MREAAECFATWQQHNATCGLRHLVTLRRFYAKQTSSLLWQLLEDFGSFGPIVL